MAVAPVFYSLSPFGAGSSYDLKNGSPTLTISGGVATLTVAQTGNIGVGCDIDFGAGPTNVYIAPNRLGFDSGGTTELKTGDKIEGGTSSATGIVRAIEITGGTWAGGDAAGYLYFSTTSGTWQDNEQINRIKPSSSSDIATADGTLEGNLGNGDTQFVVKDPDGSDASDVGSAQTVNYIYHEWASLSAYEANFTDANHINNADLTAAAVVAHACCYYDHVDQTADTTPVNIDWTGTTSATYYLRVFTPTGSSESINSQRHDGKWNTNKYYMYLTGTWDDIIDILEQYTVIEGLQFEFLLPTTNSSAIYSNSNELTMAYNIIKGSLGAGATYHPTGIRYSNKSGGIIYHNIIYGIKGGASDQYGIGIYGLFSDGYCYCNTVYDNGVGIWDQNAEWTLKNNIANDNTDDYYPPFSAGTHNITNLSAQEGAWGFQTDSGNCDGIGAATFKLKDTGQNFTTTVQVGCIVKNTTDTTYSYVTVINSDTELTLNDDIMDDGENYIIYSNMYGSVTFENAGAGDFHLGSGDTVAKDKGTDLSSDANLPIWNDIDGDARGATWDVGADEYISVGAVAPTGVLQGPLVGPFGGPI